MFSNNTNLAIHRILKVTPTNSFGRLYTVLSWGRNTEGQCGVEVGPIVSQPTPVLEFSGSPVDSVFAGKRSSAALLSNGDAWTWGCGNSGNLGLNNVEPVVSPSRVESLVGRARVKDMSMGEKHTLFVDEEGGLWSCGHNQEGQCGSATPASYITHLHNTLLRGTSRQSVTLHLALKTLQAQDYLGQHLPPYRQSHTQQLSLASRAPHLGAEMPSTSSSPSWLGSSALAAADVGTSSMRLDDRPPRGKGEGWRGLGSWREGSSDGLVFNAMDVKNQFNRCNVLEPGCQSLPIRVGLDSNDLLEWSPRQLSHGFTYDTASTLGKQEVVSVAASQTFSVAATTSGDVWSFGWSKDGCMGSGAHWHTAAQRVGGKVGETLAALGGARTLAATNMSVLALTAAGRVVLWGRALGGERKQHLSTEEGSSALEMVSACETLQGEVVPGLEHITMLAAGKYRALVSDGERVWVIGGSTTASWKKPMELVRVAEGVAQVAVGESSCAIVTRDGKLYLWGEVLCRQEGEFLVRHLSKTDQSAALGRVNWGWTGLAAPGPVPHLVPRVEGVRRVALGAAHVLAVVDS